MNTAKLSHQDEVYFFISMYYLSKSPIFRRQNCSWIIAQMLALVFFGCLHFHQWIVVIVQTGLTGFLLGLISIVNDKQSLWINIIAHSTINIISLTAIYWRDIDYCLLYTTP